MKVKLSRIECVKVGDDIRNLLNRTGLSEEGIKLIVSLSTQLSKIKEDVVKKEPMPLNDDMEVFRKEFLRLRENFQSRFKKRFQDFYAMGGDKQDMPEDLATEWTKQFKELQEKHPKAMKFKEDHEKSVVSFKNEEVEITLPYDGRKIDLIRQCTPYEWGSLELVFNKLDKTK
jgi:hypothetical protein